MRFARCPAVRPPSAPARAPASASTDGSTLLRLAEQAVALANSRPQEARESALAVLRAAPPASGRGARDRGARTRAGRQPRRGPRRGTGASQPDRSGTPGAPAIRHSEAEARLSRAYAFAQDGRFRAAFAELDLAEPALAGDDRGMGRVHNQRAAVWWLKRRRRAGPVALRPGRGAQRTGRRRAEPDPGAPQPRRPARPGRRLRRGRARPHPLGGAGRPGSSCRCSSRWHGRTSAGWRRSAVTSRPRWPATTRPSGTTGRTARSWAACSWTAARCC